MSFSLTYDHTGLVNQSRDLGGNFLLDMLGGEVHAYGKKPSIETGFRGFQISMDGQILEVTEPTRPDSFLQTYLTKKGPGWHHITFYVDGMNDYIDTLQAKNIPLTGLERSSDGVYANAFIRPSASHSVLFQFRPDDTADRMNDPDLYRNLPPPRPLRGRIKSTALAVLDGEAAAEFFHHTLGGDLGPVFRRRDAAVRPLNVAGTTLEIMSPVEPDGPLNRWLATAGAGIWYVTMELTRFDEVMQFLASRGLATGPGEDAHTVYLTKDNPTGGIFRFIDLAKAAR